MKTKLGILALSLLISFTGFSQDTTSSSTQSRITFKNGPKIHSTITAPEKKNVDTYNPSLYDIRMGSSSPMYNTYQKNDYGAGSVTNNPNKGSSEAPAYVPAVIDSIKK